MSSGRDTLATSLRDSAAYARYSETVFITGDDEPQKRLAQSQQNLIPPARRFPPPWSVEEYNDACFIVRDTNGQALSYVYFEDEAGRRSVAKLLTRDEARRIAANIAKLPDLLQKR